MDADMVLVISHSDCRSIMLLAPLVRYYYLI